MVEGLIPWCGELGTFQDVIARRCSSVEAISSHLHHIHLLFSDNVVKTSLGDLSGEGTPGPIPNPEVKLVSADGTWRATSRESRSLPRGFSFNVRLKTCSVLIESCIMLPVRPVEGSFVPSLTLRGV